MVPRLLIALLAGALTCLAAAPIAAGKGDVRARLTTPVALDAAAGTPLHLAWTLRSPDGPFGAGGVFVELRGAGGRTAVGRARDSDGGYDARVTVPEGGIAAIRIGVEGLRYSGGAPGSPTAVATPAPFFFPIENDPIGGGPSSPPGDSLPLWAVLAAALAVLAALFAARRAITGRRAVA
jgi:hypothetical protein